METIIILRCRSSFDCETIFMVVKVTGLFGLGFFSRSHMGKSLEFDFYLCVSVLQRGAICLFPVSK